jgi:hypothetical protein
LDDRNDAEPDDRTLEEQAKQPSERELVARQRWIFSRLGRWSRARSWATLLVGLVALALSLVLMARQ